MPDGEKKNMLTAYQMLDLKPRNPFFSLALDEAICLYFGQNPGFHFGGAVRLWSNPASIILGRTCEPVQNLQQEYLNGITVSHRKAVWNGDLPMLCRRASGGGTVIHGPGNLNYSIFLPLKQHPGMFGVRESYHKLLGIIKKVLQIQGISCEMEGDSDLVLVHEDGGSKKISGNSQFRKYGIVTHHGTLVTRRDLIQSAAKYLRHPPKEPSYRAGRGHSEFMSALPESFDLSAFHHCLSSELCQLFKVETLRRLNPDDLRNIYRLARKLARQVYARREWILDGKVSRKGLTALIPPIQNVARPLQESLKKSPEKISDQKKALGR